jgi:hypothetical protein
MALALVPPVGSTEHILGRTAARNSSSACSARSMSSSTPGNARCEGVSRAPDKQSMVHHSAVATTAPIPHARSGTHTVLLGRLARFEVGRPCFRFPQMRRSITARTRHVEFVQGDNATVPWRRLPFADERTTPAGGAGPRANSSAASSASSRGCAPSPLRSPGLRGRERESSRGDPVGRRPGLGDCVGGHAPRDR